MAKASFKYLGIDSVPIPTPGSAEVLTISADLGSGDVLETPSTVVVGSTLEMFSEELFLCFVAMKIIIDF